MEYVSTQLPTRSNAQDKALVSIPCLGRLVSGILGRIRPVLRNAVLIFHDSEYQSEPGQKSGLVSNNVSLRLASVCWTLTRLPIFRLGLGFGTGIPGLLMGTSTNVHHVQRDQSSHGMLRRLPAQARLLYDMCTQNCVPILHRRQLSTICDKLVGTLHQMIPRHSRPGNTSCSPTGSAR
jgi:hypothetical protein